MPKFAMHRYWLRADANRRTRLEVDTRSAALTMQEGSDFRSRPFGSLAMIIEQLRAVHQADPFKPFTVPFKPFTVHLADGRSLHVPHREFLSQSPGGRTLIVYHEDESFSILDLLLVTELKVTNGKGRQPRRRTD